ncbi:MAG: archaemetzincin family Zn-dependent metalloprotease [candidate division NC10 bacterium]|nr:archaemetzincin family Zn-dependent metalloprotease [candidate division NC10 bacterium]
MIALVHLGDVDPSLLHGLSEQLELAYRRKVEHLSPLPLPNEAYNKKRLQFLSTAILKRLFPLRIPGRERVLGIADVDLYVPGLNFVFGEADPKEGVAVFSLFRLKPESGTSSDEGLLRRRALTEAVHELGHTYGLGHCPNPRCVMFFSNSLGDTDRKGPGFCRRCEGRLFEKAG